MPQIDAAGRRLLIIRNPLVGRAARSRLNAIVGRLEAQGCTVSTRDSRAPGQAGDARSIAAATSPKDADVVIAAGGDGTVREILAGLAANSGPAPALAVLPLGTANILAAELGLPGDADGLARAIAQGRICRVRFGALTQASPPHGETPLVFVNMVGAGFDARVVAGVSLGLKRRLGKFAYVWSALCQHLQRQARIKIRLDGDEFEVASVIVTKVRYYAGRYLMAPRARLEDEKLHVCLFERSGIAATLGYQLGLLTGGLQRRPGFSLRTARVVEILGPVGDSLQADGDVVAGLPVRITLQARPLTVVMPAHRG